MTRSTDSSGISTVSDRPASSPASEPAASKPTGVAAPLREIPAPCGPGRPGFGARVVGDVSRRLPRALAAARAAWWRARARGRIRSAAQPLRICLGSGAAPLAGWVNVDMDAAAPVRLDLRYPLPIDDASASLIYSEHVIEHLSLEDGLALLRECRRVLREDGVLRIATPDLDALVRSYLGDWRAQDWVNWPGHEWIDTRARMLNVSFREWGHQHLYDHEELTARLAAAGFAEKRRCAIGESPTPGLAGLETRADSLLIVEAWGAAHRRRP
jgi:predicted SAM-dependent methyltransferase